MQDGSHNPSNGGSKNKGQSAPVLNEYVQFGDFVALALPSSAGPKQCLIDSADLERVLAAGRWAAACFCKKSNKWYAYTVKDRRNVYLHRFLTNAPAGLEVDHKNGDGLDNTRRNIRVTTGTVNQFNRFKPNKNNLTGYRGVSPERGKFLARLDINQKTVRLGLFTDPFVAAMRVQWELVTSGLVHGDKVRS